MGPIRLLFKTYRQQLAQRFADGTVSAVLWPCVSYFLLYLILALPCLFILALSSHFCLLCSVCSRYISALYISCALTSWPS